MSVTVHRAVIISRCCLLRNTLRELTDRFGIRVVGEAETTREAERLLESNHPTLVILDLWLGRDGGINWIKAVAKRRPGCKILVYSALNERLYAERALRAGAHAFVEHHASTECVLRAIRGVLAGELVVSDSVRNRMLQRAAGHARLDLGDPLQRLSDRELEVFALIGGGASAREIGLQLGISVNTVHTYREKLKEKLECRSGAELIMRAMHWILDGGPQMPEHRSPPARPLSARGAAADLGGS